jgi:CO dehydrogenase maturation factor
VKISFVGKGGSGKTTLAALFARYLAEADPAGGGRPRLLAIDADINQHLGAALGATEAEAARLPALGEHLGEIKEYLRGENPRISSAGAMVKTTPPGRGSRLLPVDGINPIYAELVREVGGVRLAVTGPFGADDLGVSCYHAKVGAVELLLNHLVDGPGEYVVVDMTAGADSFASGLFTRFDATFLVCEPTLRSVGVYRQYVGADLLTWLSRSRYVKGAERGAPEPLDALEPANRAALDLLRTTVDAQAKDWAGDQRHAVEFHLRNALAWANDRVGEDLAGQVDPEFVPGPQVPVR